MSDSTITFITLAAVVVLFVSNRVPVAVIAVGTTLSLWATGILEIDEATAGFGDPTVLFIAALFVVSEALDSTGVTADGGQPSSPARVRARRWLPPARRLASSRG